MKRFLVSSEKDESTKRTKKQQRHLLTGDGRSWVDIIPVEMEGDTLQELIGCKPTKRGYIKRAGELIEVPRTQAMYFHSYFFSGVDHPPEPEVPPVIQRFLDWTNATAYITDRTDGFAFNQVIGNWYMNGHEYISAHRDNELQLRVGPDGETTILGANYGAARTVRFRSATRSDPTATPKLDLLLKPGTAYVMGGTTNRTHTHEIVKVAGKKGLATAPRVSLTARCFPVP